mmetsp:Transcript_32382/g.81478  ORF Transcript_32382/g.81478 Transcript_32382/m.81478 type:complete len:252 (-) Transcript_32382:163-918(-)
MDNESKTVGSRAVESMSSRRHLPPPLPPPHGAGDGPAPTTPLQLPRSSLAGARASVGTAATYSRACLPTASRASTPTASYRRASHRRRPIRGTTHRHQPIRDATRRSSQPRALRMSVATSSWRSWSTPKASFITQRHRLPSPTTPLPGSESVFAKEGRRRHARRRCTAWNQPAAAVVQGTRAGAWMWTQLRIGPRESFSWIHCWRTIVCTRAGTRQALWEARVTARPTRVMTTGRHYWGEVQVNRNSRWGL